MAMQNISGIDKALLLQSLVNNATHSGMGSPMLAMATSMNPKISFQTAQNYILKAPNLCFDYVEARSIKCDISKDVMNDWLYDRDNGQGRAKYAIDQARANNR